MTRQQETFAEYFASWGLTLPDEAATSLRSGYLKGAGWSVRFVWRADGALVFRAGHRMTNERVHAISPNGEFTDAGLAAPSEFMVVPDGANAEDQARIQQEYRQEWRTYGQDVEAADLDYDRGPRVTPSRGMQLWRLDEGEWQSAPLRPAGRQERPS